jgi:hypothetical protein
MTTFVPVLIPGSSGLPSCDVGLKSYLHGHALPHGSIKFTGASQDGRSLSCSWRSVKQHVWQPVLVNESLDYRDVVGQK